MLTRRPSAPVTFIEGLRGLRVAVPKGSAVADALAAAKVPASGLEEFATAAEALAALQSGRAAAAVVRLDQAFRPLGQDADLQMGVGLGPRQSLAFAVRKGDAALLQSLNQHLLQLRRTPSWGYLVEKHYGRQALTALARARLSELPAGGGRP